MNRLVSAHSAVQKAHPYPGALFYAFPLLSRLPIAMMGANQ